MPFNSIGDSESVHFYTADIEKFVHCDGESFSIMTANYVSRLAIEIWRMTVVHIIAVRCKISYRSNLVPRKFF